MTERQSYLERAEGLVNDAVEMRERIARTRPDSLPIAQQIIDDSVRCYALAEGARRINASVRMQMAAYLTRALLLSEALNAGPQ